MTRLIRRALCRLLPPTGAHRAADSQHYAADDRPTMAIPRVPDPGQLVRPFYVAFEERRTAGSRGGFTFRRSVQEACTSLTSGNAADTPASDPSDPSFHSHSAKTYMCTCTDIPMGNRIQGHQGHKEPPAAPDTPSDQGECEMHTSPAPNQRAVVGAHGVVR